MFFKLKNEQRDSLGERSANITFKVWNKFKSKTGHKWFSFVP